MLGASTVGASAAFVLTTGQLNLPHHQQQDQGRAGSTAAEEAAPLLLPQQAEALQPQLKDLSQMRLWNPLTGHCVPVRDPACEMREVSSCGIFTVAY